MSSPAVLPEETTPALSEGQRLLYTFTAPSQTMADIRRNAGWWVPWLLISIFALGFAFTLDKKIGWDQVMENQIQSSPKAAERMEKVPADQREKILKMQTNVARGIGYATPVTTVIYIAIIGAILLGIFNFGFGAKLKFGQAMSITAYSMLPNLLQYLLMILMMFLIEPDQFNINNAVATNPGYFVAASSPVLKGFLGAFDVFILWQLFLLSVGAEQLAKVKKTNAFITLFVMVVLWKLATSAMGS
jgi:hypothetical protein